MSPYCYVANNPTKFIDPNGEDFIMYITYGDDGKTITGITISATVYIQGDGASNGLADDMTAYARNNLTKQTVNKVDVNFDVQYKYDPDKKAEDLKIGNGENLLVLTNEIGKNGDGIPDNSVLGSVTHHKNSTEFPSYIKTYTTTGNNGKIYKSGLKNYGVYLHESLHFLGMDEQYYTDNNGNDHDFSGYEGDVMSATGPANSYNNRTGSIIVNKSHYESFYRFALIHPKSAAYRLFVDKPTIRKPYPKY